MVSQPEITRDSRYATGLQLYARGMFYECHEVLEDLWRECAPRDRFFVQSLIHLAVAFYQTGRANREGAILQLGKCSRKLAGYLPAYAGVNTLRLLGDVEAARHSLVSGEAPHAIRIY